LVPLIFANSEIYFSFLPAYTNSLSEKYAILNLLPLSFLKISSAPHNTIDITQRIYAKLRYFGISNARNTESIGANKAKNPEIKRANRVCRNYFEHSSQPGNSSFIVFETAEPGIFPSFILENVWRNLVLAILRLQNGHSSGKEEITESDLIKKGIGFSLNYFISIMIANGQDEERFSV